jgi:phenylalanyl-tRNA synthetase beta chain
VYRGDKIPAGKKQYALSFVFLDEEKTLTDQAIEQMTNKLLGAFTKFHNAALR